MIRFVVMTITTSANISDTSSKKNATIYIFGLISYNQPNVATVA